MLTTLFTMIECRYKLTILTVFLCLLCGCLGEVASGVESDQVGHYCTCLFYRETSLDSCCSCYRTYNSIQINRLKSNLNIYPSEPLSIWISLESLTLHCNCLCSSTGTSSIGCSPFSLCNCSLLKLKGM